MSARLIGPARQLRRPARGGYIIEFFFGLLAGVLASFIVSFGMDLTPTTPKAINPSITAVTSLPVKPPPSPPDPMIKTMNNKQIENNEEWTPKPRLAGYKTPKIICAVTQQLLLETVPGVINATWGSRCDRLVFTAPRIGINSPHGLEVVQVEKMGDKDSNWQTLRSMLKNLELKDEDYLFVVDDYTYAIPDNIRYEFRGPNPGQDHLFWGRKAKGREYCKTQAFVLSRKTFQDLQGKLRAEAIDPACDLSSQDAPSQLRKCLGLIKVECTEAIDFQGKFQFMDDPVQLLAVDDQPAHMRKGPECCSVLPVVFFNVGKMHAIRTGIFSYQYFYDYFIRDTAVYGREYMRPLNGIDAGVGKRQVGF
jgi:hypothetical protein